ncbi:MAG: hypothetical protein KIH69_007795, partial [Anaerolineae bacterium]|nr:hypothetical protein [Anaerolineae bacterium]
DVYKRQTPLPGNTATPTPTATPASNLPQITIIVNAAPYSIQNFSFNSNIVGLTSFALDNMVPDDNDGVPMSRTMTVNPGNYYISQLVPATWQLGEINCTTTGSATATTNLNTSTASMSVQNNSSVTCTFNNWRDGNIYTSVFRDSNANGILDANENMLKNWSIRLYEVTGPSTRILRDTRTTNNSGQANFNNWPSNRTYQVCQVMQSGWTNTVPTGVVNNEVCYTLTLAPGTSVNRAFGNRPTVLNRLSSFNIDWMSNAEPATTQPSSEAALVEVADLSPPVSYLAYARLPVPFDTAGDNGHIYADQPDQFEKHVYLPMARAMRVVSRK